MLLDIFSTFNAKILNMDRLSLVLTIGLLLFLLGCRKDETADNNNKAILSLLNKPEMRIDTIEAASEWVYGFTIQMQANKSVSKIGMKLPLPGAFTASLWDIKTQTILREVVLTSTSPHEEVFASFSPVPVDKGAVLGVIIQANSFYKIRQTSGQPFAFPLNTPHFDILAFHEGKASELPAKSFPPTSTPEEISPCVDIIFID
jgi:hypothetical protein